MPKKIYLVDGNNFIYRMFFALPEFATKDGKIVNAVFGMAKFFVGQLAREKPDYLVFIRDAKGKNFRHDLYDDYKATRDRMPDNLRSQIPIIQEMVGLMGIELVEIEGYEADDVIGTLAKKYSQNKDYEVDILTGDKDLYQFTDENVVIYDTMKRKKFGPQETIEKFGVENKRVVDYLAIVGDKSDNIPGIDGFGPKKAVDLINIIGTVEDIYTTADKIKSGEKLEDCHPELDSGSIKSISSCFKGKTFEKLLDSRDSAFLSKRLATIDTSVEIKDFSLEKFKFIPENLLNDDVKEFFKNLEFNSLIGETDEPLKKWSDLGLKVKIVGDELGLDELEKKIADYDEIVFDTETTSLNIINAELVGLSIYLDDKNIYYINRLHNGPKVEDNKLKDFLNNFLKLDKTLIAHNLKYDLEIIDMFLSKKEDKIGTESFGQTSLDL